MSNKGLFIVGAGSLIGAGWLWLAALLQALLAAVLCFVPLLDLLGYEFCFTAGLLAAVTGPIIGLVVAGRRARGVEALGWALALALLHLVPGLLLISLNALRVRVCDYGEGLGFYAVLTAANATYGASLGTLVGALLRSARRGWRSVLVAGVIVGPLACALYRLYTQPQIFAVDHLWGYFAGSLYDEGVKLDQKLVIFRLTTLGRVAAIGWILHAWDNRPSRGGVPRLAAMAGLALAGAIFFEAVLEPAHGLRATRTQIEQQLPVRVERPGLVVHMSRAVPVRRRQAIADDHAFRLAQLRQRFGLSSGPVIRSYVYDNSRQKARLMGGRGTMVAKPWLREIHIHGATVPHRMMPHELAHAVAAEFGSRLLGVSARFELLVNLGLVEGLAEAVTPDRGQLDLHAWARAIRDLGIAPDLRQILGPAGFWSQAPRRAYTTAGSFIRFLLDTHGAPPLMAAYARGGFEAAYGQPLETLLAAWQRHLDAIELSEAERRIAAERYRRTSIFSRPCAHEVAQLRQRAATADPQREVALRRKICDFSGDDPTARLELSAALRRAGDDDAFLASSEELLADGRLNAVQRGRLLAMRGEVLWGRGELDSARDLFRRVGDLQLGQDSERLQWVRLWALQQPAQLRELMRRFLGRDLPALAAVVGLLEQVRNHPADKTLPYLIARQLAQKGAHDMALGYLQQAADHPFAPIEQERLRLEADGLWRLRRYAQAAERYRRYLRGTPLSGERARAEDWLARLRWASQALEPSGSQPR